MKLAHSLFPVTVLPPVTEAILYTGHNVGVHRAEGRPRLLQPAKSAKQVKRGVTMVTDISFLTLHNDTNMTWFEHCKETIMIVSIFIAKTR